MIFFYLRLQTVPNPSPVTFWSDNASCCHFEACHPHKTMLNWLDGNCISSRHTAIHPSNNKFVHNNLSRSRTRRPVADTEGKVWERPRHVWSSGHSPSQCNSCSQQQSHASWRPPVTMTGRLRASRHSVIRFGNLTGSRMSAGISFDRTPHGVIPEGIIMVQVENWFDKL